MLALPVYQELASALRARLTVIADREFYRRAPEAHLQRLQDISLQIVTLQKKLPPPVDPQLAHFLERSSYDKALRFIEEMPGAENS